MKYLLVILFCLLTYTSFTQVSFDKRVEFELKNGFSNENMNRFGEIGFILCSVSEKDIKGENTWRYEVFNTNLEHTKTLDISLHKSFFRNEAFNSDTHIHTLFTNKKGDFSLIGIEALSLKKTEVSGLFPKKAFIKDMAVLGDYAFFEVSIKKSQFLYSINWKTGKKNIITVQIPSYKNKNLRIRNFQIIPHSNEVFLYIKAFHKKEFETYILQLNDTGEKQDLFKLNTEEDKNIVSISASSIGNGKYIFTGTYSSKYSTRSEGLFFCEAAKSSLNYIKYYSFLDLDKFLSYLSERRQMKLEKKKAKKEAKGKKLKINYRIADHNIILQDDNYLFLGEAYYPTYRTETYTTFVNGEAVTRSRQVFDGYQYTHAVLVKFNSSGDLIWDQTFEMWQAYKPYYAKRFISVREETENSINMVFTSRNRILSKAIDFDGEITLEEESDVIEMMHEGDKSRYTSSNLNYWYDRYFLAYGKQKIKNKEDNSVKKKRKVYFISKIKY